MKYFFVCILICSLCSSSFAEPVNNSTGLNKTLNIEKTSDKTKLESEINRLILLQKDTIKLKTKIEFANDKRNIFDYLLPSLIALVVALIAFSGSLYTMKRQIESSKDTLALQIKASKETMDQQIESAKYTAELGFRQNVLSSNRVDWIENVRKKVSLLSSKMLILSNIQDAAKQVEEMEQIMEICAYVELMLNPNDDRDNDFIKLLKELPIIIIESNDKEKGIQIGKIRRDIIDLTKVILKTEWERVKKGE